MHACLQSIPDSIVCDGIFFNYYRSDIRCIQFLALATHKTARLKRDIIPIPEVIAKQFNHSDNFSTQVIDTLSQCPLTEYVVNTCFRNIKSLILMRMHWMVYGLARWVYLATGLMLLHLNMLNYSNQYGENSPYWPLLPFPDITFY